MEVIGIIRMVEVHGNRIHPFSQCYRINTGFAIRTRHSFGTNEIGAQDSSPFFNLHQNGLSHNKTKEERSSVLAYPISVNSIQRSLFHAPMHDHLPISGGRSKKL